MVALCRVRPKVCFVARQIATAPVFEYALLAVLRRVSDDDRMRRMDPQLRDLTDELKRLSERVYGAEDRSDSLNSRLEVMKDELRGDINIALDRLDGLRQLLERSRDEERQQRKADQELLYALVKDHNRRLRAIERLQRRAHAQQP
jgi:hypothetical protein